MSGALKTRLDPLTKIAATVSAVYRSALAAADLLAAPGTVTCTKQTGGAATAGEYTVYVVAGNSQGRTTATAGNTTVTTETTNLTVRAAFALVTGAEFYDIYGSTDGAASKFVGRVTEAQRLSGITITGQNTLTAGGAANAVDIRFPGTGLAVNAGHIAVNTAYVIPAAVIDAAGYQYVDFDLQLATVGDSVLPTLVVLPMLLNTRLSKYVSFGAAQTVVFGGASGAVLPLKQRVRVEARGATVVLVIVSITGTTATVDIDATLS